MPDATPPARPGIVLRANRRVPALGYGLVGALKVLPLRIPRRRAVSVLADGRRLWGDLGDHTQRKMLFDRFEPRETELVLRLLRSGDTLVDVGAHVGWFTTAGAGAVGSSGRVVAIEAFPPNAATLRANVMANGLDWVEIRHAAAAAAAGRLTVGVQADSDSGSVTAGPWAARDVVEVDAVRIDDVAPAGPIRLMKLDVEGFEEQALSGAADALSRTEHVLVELNREALEVAGTSSEAVIERLQDAGLTHHRFLEYPRQGTKEGVPNFVNLLASRSTA